LKYRRGLRHADEKIFDTPAALRQHRREQHKEHWQPHYVAGTGTELLAEDKLNAEHEQCDDSGPKA